MNMAEKNPVVIVHEADSASPKLPSGYRFEYTTHVEGDIVTIIVSVMKSSPVLRFFTGRDRHIKSLTRHLSRELSVQRSAKSMEAKLASILFSAR